MQNYEIKEIDIQDENSRKEITDLVNEVFNMKLSDEEIILNTYTRNKKSIYLGAFLNNTLAAVNIFISHELQYNNKNIIAFQSCWSATSKDHRGKGLFPLIINTAKERLKGAFIFGFPNENSYPIFLKKLGFREIPLTKINIPVKFLPNLFLGSYLKSVKNNYQLDVKNSFLPVESELIELKENECQNKIKRYGSYNNLIWGKIEKRKTRIGNLNFFCVGGIQVNKPHLLRLVFREIIKKEKIDFIQIIGSSNSSFWDLFKNIKEAPKTEPLIIYDLDIDTKDSKFNFVSGIKDVF